MDQEKQIEEMAELICDNKDDRGVCSTDGCVCNYNCEYRYSAEALYDAGYRKQSEGEWISVEERVPEDEKAVLCYYGFDRGDGDLGMMFVGVLSYFCFDLDPHWQHASTGITVTHWMPLPEPPKMKGGAEE